MIKTHNFKIDFNGKAMTLERLRQYMDEVMIANDEIIADIQDHSVR